MPLKRYQNHSLSFPQAGYLCLAILIAGLYSALSYSTPLYIDDWMFLANWKHHAGSSSFSFSGWLDYYLFTRDFDNGRISNSLAVFTSMFSPFKEIFPALNGMMVALLIILCQRFICFGRNFDSLLWLALTWLGCLVFLPWIPLFVADYSLNYIWGGVITLSLLWNLLRNETGGWSVSRFFIAILLAVLAGGWHESISIATICGLGLLILVKGRHLSQRFYVIFLIFMASTLIFGFSEGMRNRFGWEFLSSLSLPHKRVLIIWIFLIGVLMVAATSKKGRAVLRAFLNSPIAVCCAGIAAAGYVIGILTRNAPRTFFWPNTALLIMLFRFAALYAGTRPKLHCRLSAKILIVSLSVVFCTFQIVWTISAQIPLKKSWEKLYAVLEKSEQGIVYFNPEEFDVRFSRWMIMRPVGAEINNGWQNQTLWMYFRTPFLSFIPRHLKEASYGNAEKLKGTLNASAVNGLVVAPFRPGSTTSSPRLPYPLSITLFLKNGDRVETEAYASPYIPLYSSETYAPDTLMYLSIPTIDAGEIEAIEPTP